MRQGPLDELQDDTLSRPLRADAAVDERIETESRSRTLERILENAVPQTLQDVVIIYAVVTGMQDGEFREENYVNKMYPDSNRRPPSGRRSRSRLQQVSAAWSI